MKVYRIIPALAIFALLPACQSYRNYNAAQEFTLALREYNRMLRWQEIDQACISFVVKARREECLLRAEAAREVKVADYRVLTEECTPEKGTAETRVAVDYYLPPSSRVKTLEDLQLWRYSEGPDDKGWRLTTLPPLFK